MGVRYTQISIEYLQDFGGWRTLILPLTIDDQQDARLRALLDWYRAYINAKIASEGPADPTVLLG